MPDSVSSRVVVIGAGIVGACCALELVRDGHRVTIVEPGEPGGRHGASYGHGCWISPASVVPMSMPGLWKRLPGYLLDAHGPFVIRWRHIGTLLPWLVRFLLAGSTVGRVEATARALKTLLHDGPARHLALAAELGMPETVRREGLLYAYPDRKAFEAEGLSWRLRGMTGLGWKELDRDQLRAREPGLAGSYGFGILVEAGAHCLDPGAYVARIVETAVRRGARHIRARAGDFVFRDERLVAVEAEGSRIGCDRAVVAAGVWSGKLARLAGDIATTIFHPVGTTRMGRVDDPQAVLDPQMRVRDGRGGVVAGLRVVDAGAMPTITSGNTNSPTLMMAEMAAQWIRAAR